MGAEIIVHHTSLETRVALMSNNQVTELFIERQRDKGIVGNIYKGRVSKVLPGMQAAFVDIGLKKAGFLYVADINANGHVNGDEQVRALEVTADDDELKQGQEADAQAGESAERRTSLRYPIEELIQEGQEILVQVSKEPLGTKGCRVTTYITLPGRYLVYMPTVDHIGISRRIEDEEERTRLRELVAAIKAPGDGYIVRTVSEGMNEEELASDIDYLSKLWATVQEKDEHSVPPALVHPDLDLVLRSIRDLFSADIDRFLINSQQEYERCLAFVRSYLPHLEPKIERYVGEQSIFDAFGIELEIERALGSKIWLKSGGDIIIDQTEALVVIDVNTGRFVGTHSAEETILKTNLEAVNEIVYQLRLRNIGGLIIIDFIDMEREESKERVFQTLEYALKNDRSRTNILRVSELGLVEMTRKRVRESLARTLCEPCSYCQGRGYVKSPTTVCYEVFREIARGEKPSQEYQKVLVTVHTDVADEMLDEESSYLEHLELELNKSIIIKADNDLHQEQYEVVYI